jgi:hypothetical protein
VKRESGGYLKYLGYLRSDFKAFKSVKARDLGTNMQAARIALKRLSQPTAQLQKRTMSEMLFRLLLLRFRYQHKLFSQFELHTFSPARSLRTRSLLQIIPYLDSTQMKHCGGGLKVATQSKLELYGHSTLW